MTNDLLPSRTLRHAGEAVSIPHWRGVQIDDQRLADILSPGAGLLKLYEGTIHGEGPAWMPGSLRLVWSDVPNRRLLGWYLDGRVEVVIEGTWFMNGTAVMADGRLIHAEASRLDADPRQRQNLSLLAGANAFATLLYLGPDAERRAAAIRALPDNPLLGSTRIGEKLVVRALAPSGIALRRAIVPIIALLSERGQVPRLWSL